MEGPTVACPNPELIHQQQTSIIINQILPGKEKTSKYIDLATLVCNTTNTNMVLDWLTNAADATEAEHGYAVGGEDTELKLILIQEWTTGQKMLLRAAQSHTGPSVYQPSVTIIVQQQHNICCCSCMCVSMCCPEYSG